MSTAGRLDPGEVESIANRLLDVSENNEAKQLARAVLGLLYLRDRDREEAMRFADDVAKIRQIAGTLLNDRMAAKDRERTMPIEGGVPPPMGEKLFLDEPSNDDLKRLADWYPPLEGV